MSRTTAKPIVRLTHTPQGDTMVYLTPADGQGGAAIPAHSLEHGFRMVCSVVDYLGIGVESPPLDHLQLPDAQIAANAAARKGGAQ